MSGVPAPAGRVYVMGDRRRVSELPAPIEICTDWAIALAEPLLPTAVRARAESNLAWLALSNPRFFATFIGGVTADLVLTFPERDRWRNLSWRLGDRTGGVNPPATTGAQSVDGAPFGSWRDGADLVKPLYASPASDPGLAALAADMVPEGAVLLAVSATGHREAGNLAWLVYESASPESGSGKESAAQATRLLGGDSATGSSATDRLKAAILLEAGTSAIRWAAHRRRAYLGDGDSWLGEAIFRWAYRADCVEKGKEILWRDVDAGVAAEKIVQLAPQERPEDDNWDDF